MKIYQETPEKYSFRRSDRLLQCDREQEHILQSEYTEFRGCQVCLSTHPCEPRHGLLPLREPYREGLHIAPSRESFAFTLLLSLVLGQCLPPLLFVPLSQGNTRLIRMCWSPQCRVILHIEPTVYAGGVYGDRTTYHRAHEKNW